jgi:dolichyl-phosphate-mannose--protein O-mannosyl transferase
MTAGSELITLSVALAGVTLGCLVSTRWPRPVFTQSVAVEGPA